MTWLLIVFIVAGVAVAVRIYFGVRKGLESERGSDWDEKMIARLRKQGSDPFQPHEVDFFFALPSEAACQAVRSQLEVDGFTVDTRPVEEDPERALSLHAHKSLRLSVPDMQALSRRFAELARTHGGRYDGWAAGIVHQTTSSPRW
jgi:hypothetical protein